jgi:hypothetical protein
VKDKNFTGRATQKKSSPSINIGKEEHSIMECSRKEKKALKELG